MTVFPVILCGGAGTRLWPVSRSNRPKQFVNLISGEPSLFSGTVERVARLPGLARLLIVTGEGMADSVRGQLGDHSADILLEPEGRDSAPAMAAAAAHAERLDPEAVCVFVASDHRIPDVARFLALAEQAVDAAREGRIVTFGIRPTRPETAYGYIRPKDRSAPISEVDTFTEKPDAETARKFIDEGYLWNSGNFVAAARTLLREFDRHAPEVAAVAREAVRLAKPVPGGIALDEVFRQAKKISVDYAVMEPTDRASVIASDLSWSDLGAWDSVAAVEKADGEGNRATGPVVLSEARGCYVRADAAVPVAVHGVEGLAVLVEPDGVLVCPLAESQAVKALAGRAEALREDPGHVSSPGMRGGELLRTWLFEDAFPLWWTFGTDHEGWGFHESLTRDLSPTGADRRLRVQARQTWCFARAGALGWPGPWRTAVRFGFDGIERHYRRDDGLYRSLVSAGGAVVDDTPLVYDQAFVLLALAVAHPALEDAEARAEDLLDAVERHNRHTGGGFRENGLQPYQANAHMHLFEACLAWTEAGGGPRWHGLAEEIATMAIERFIDSDTGRLREFYEPDWTPRQDETGEVVEPGHLFEWAWLFWRWSRLGMSDRALATARILLQGTRSGIDPARGAVMMRMLPDGTITDPTARLWGQTEWLKALLCLEGAQADIDTAFRTLWRYLDMPTSGLWQDRLTPDDRFVEEPVSGSSFYHVVGAIETVLERMDASVAR